jgi:RND superfamily putative drug exporter
MDGSNIIFIFSVAFGLSVDYEVFLLSRVLEEYKILKNIDLAVIHAVQKTGGLITSAAVMLAVTTIAFIFAKIYFIKLIGVGIAVAVVLDATIIRMILVPASIKLFGEYNFYCPYYLKKVVDFVGLVESEDGLDSLDKENRLFLGLLYDS